jgi:membrane associated rhomboid family serine protease
MAVFKARQRTVRLLKMQYQTQQFSFGPGAVTPAVKFLLIANTAVFIVQTVVGIGLDYQLSLYFGLVPALVLQILPLAVVHLPVPARRAVSSVVQYAGVWMFGCDLERRWGSNFFLRYYFVSVIGGGILNTLFLPNQMGPSIGASAGVYGILLAYGLIYPNRIVYFYFLFPIKMKYFVMIIGAISLYSSLTAGQSGIAHLAHLGGMVFGYIYLRGFNPWGAIKISRPPPPQPPQAPL